MFYGQYSPFFQTLISKQIQLSGDDSVSCLEWEKFIHKETLLKEDHQSYRINSVCSTLFSMSLNPFKQNSVQELVKDVYIKKALAENAVKTVRDVQVRVNISPTNYLVEGRGKVTNAFSPLLRWKQCKRRYPPSDPVIQPIVFVNLLRRYSFMGKRLIDCF